MSDPKLRLLLDNVIRADAAEDEAIRRYLRRRWATPSPSCARRWRRWLRVGLLALSVGVLIACWWQVVRP